MFFLIMSQCDTKGENKTIKNTYKEMPSRCMLKKSPLCKKQKNKKQDKTFTTSTAQKYTDI